MRDQPDLTVLKAFRATTVNQVHKALRDHKGPQANAVILVLPVLRAALASKDPKEIRANPGLRDLQEQLDRLDRKAP
jgi:hypothetical protein